jgi:hypothetical protein
MFEVLTVVLLTFEVFWVMMMCDQVNDSHVPKDSSTYYCEEPLTQKHGVTFKKT